MKLPWRGRQLSLFGQTFLLMLAALIVAEGIGLALVIFKAPPQQNHPPPFEEYRASPDEPFRGPPPRRAEPPPHDAHRDDRSFARFPPDFYQKSLLLFVIGLAALVPLAWLFAAALSTSIKRFSAAARRLGSDPNAPPLSPAGPAEMRAAVESFNAMQARLNRLLQERTLLIAAIAHDLRTPLMRLAFRLDDLHSPLKEKVERDIQEMKQMISNEQDFMRDRALGGQRERLDLRLLVESEVDNRLDLGQDVVLEAGHSMTVEGDPSALRRVVANLIDNALKYGQRARLKLSTMDEHCVLQVDDDGPGIPEPLQERVFDPFFRAEASRNRDTGGIGLGLTTVRAIVTDHGGQISLSNRSDGGLRVVIRLPVAPS